MNQKPMNAAHLIAESVSQNRIAHAEYSEKLASELEILCDDWTDNAPVVEYWGTNASKNEWRIHLERRGVES